MEEVVVTRYWMALVLLVMVVYVVAGFIGVRVQARRKKDQ